MKILINILLIIFAIILQIAFLPLVSIHGAYPNILLIVILSLLFIGRINESLWWVGIGGLVMELFSTSHFGVYIISFIVIFLLFYYFINRIFSDPSLVSAAFLFFVASLMLNIVFVIMTHYYFVYIAEAIYTAIVGCIIYSLIKYYYRPIDEVKI